MLPDILARARALLENVTPLHADCGLTCGHACCSSLAGEMTGMLLFPGEEAYYAALPGYHLVDTPQGTLVICSGRCDRAGPPLRMGHSWRWPSGAGSISALASAAGTSGWLTPWGCGWDAW